MRYIVGHVDDGKRGWYARLGIETTDPLTVRNAVERVQLELEHFGFNPRSIMWSAR